MGLTGDASCQICKSSSESACHLLKHCPNANLVWNSIGMDLHIRQSFVYNFSNWLFFNLKYDKNCFNNLS